MAWVLFNFNMLLLRLRLRVEQVTHPFTEDYQRELSERLDYLFFEAIYSAYMTLSYNRVLDLSLGYISATTRHLEIKRLHPSFYGMNLREFLIIDSLSTHLHMEGKVLVGDDLVVGEKLYRMHEYCRMILDSYYKLYDGSFNEDCLELMSGEERDFYDRVFMPLRMDILSRSA
jgi:hypothetical protein